MLVLRCAPSACECKRTWRVCVWPCACMWIFIFPLQCLTHSIGSTRINCNTYMDTIFVCLTNISMDAYNRFQQRLQILNMNTELYNVTSDQCNSSHSMWDKRNILDYFSLRQTNQKWLHWRDINLSFSCVFFLFLLLFVSMKIWLLVANQVKQTQAFQYINLDKFSLCARAHKWRFIANDGDSFSYLHTSIRFGHESEL